MFERCLCPHKKFPLKNIAWQLIIVKFHACSKVVQKGKSLPALAAVNTLVATGEAFNTYSTLSHHSGRMGHFSVSSGALAKKSLDVLYG